MTYLLNKTPFEEPGTYDLELRIPKSGTPVVCGKGQSFKGEPFSCELVPPHGRAIDAKKFVKYMQHKYLGGKMLSDKALYIIISELESFPTLLRKDNLT